MKVNDQESEERVRKKMIKFNDLGPCHVPPLRLFNGCLDRRKMVLVMGLEIESAEEDSTSLSFLSSPCTTNEEVLLVSLGHGQGTRAEQCREQF